MVCASPGDALASCTNPNNIYKLYSMWAWRGFTERTHNTILYTLYIILIYWDTNMAIYLHSNIVVYRYNFGVQYALWENINIRKKKQAQRRWGSLSRPSPTRPWAASADNGLQKCLNTVGFSCTLHGWPWVAEEARFEHYRTARRRRTPPVEWYWGDKARALPRRSSTQCLRNVLLVYPNWWGDYIIILLYWYIGLRFR